MKRIDIVGACEHNLRNLDLTIERGAMTLVTGVSGSGKSSLAFDTVLAEAQRRFFYTLSHYSRQFLDMGSRPNVRRITGLSPAISLAQNETQPSRRASVATLTDAGEMLGILYSRFGTRYCPDHALPTTSVSVEEVAEQILTSHAGQNVAICVPIAENKKGAFKKQLGGFAAKGFMKAYVDGDVQSLTPVPQLGKDEKHTIKVIIDVIKVKEERRGRLVRSLTTTLEEGQGFGEYYLATSPQAIDLDAGGRFGQGGGCPTCGYSWPDLDSRYFSANSLGRCKVCNGIGEDVEEDEDVEEHVAYTCEACRGTGLAAEYDAIRLGDIAISDLHRGSVAAARDHLRHWQEGDLGDNPAFARVAVELAAILERVCDVGLPYLHLGRRIRTLSGGEGQRLKLAGILSESLRGVLYVLDEPSQGLHPAELDQLFEVLERLKENGNTLIIVDHDEHLIRKADWVIDLGPSGGAQGGQLMAKFAPSDAGKFVDKSPTAKALMQPTRYQTAVRQDAKRGKVTFKGIRYNNLDISSLDVPTRALTTVTGVSGAGKASLVWGVITPNAIADMEADTPGAAKPIRCTKVTGLDQFDHVLPIDRKPIGKSHVSMPATYLELFKDIRELFGKLPEAQIAGLTQRDFSVTVEGGRCPECKGRGQVSLSMRFLPDARVTCPVCNGKRFRPHVLEIQYGGYSIADVLNLTLDQVAEVFKNHRRLQRRLQPAIRLGLGYLKIGQPSATLSGGEAQRLKLAPLLARPDNDGRLILMEEPTAGLHAEDVARLREIMLGLVTSGATLVVIEHNADIIAASDHVIDLGPGAASDGGRVVFAGTPTELQSDQASITARYL